MIDVFAWIVLLILVASAIAIFFIAGSLPGHIARSRGHPWAQAVTVAGWVTLICGFALWPVALIWAYVDIPARTVVRAPADGYVTNVGLMKGARVASLPLSPVMAFIDTSETVVGSRSRRSIPATSSLARRSR
jgi:uncharacterized protein DUF3302